MARTPIQATNKNMNPIVYKTCVAMKNALEDNKVIISFRKLIIISMVYKMQGF